MSKNLTVMKFGGTSVGLAERMQRVVQLVQAASTAGQLPVVVVSAMAGVTNNLIAGAEEAASRNLAGALARLESIRNKHLEVVTALFGESARAKHLSEEIELRLEELRVVYKGLSYLAELTKRSLDTVSGIGEVLSSRIIAELADERDLQPAWLDARQFLITDETFGRANPLWEELVPRVQKTLLPKVEEGKIVVTQGFIGSTLDGTTTTLGRGGSDYTASIVGSAIEAHEIQIWTDVDGMMTADPRVIPNARVLAEVSFQEASELAYFGAKVLHPMTIKPAVEKNIPVRILNTLRPEAKGTLIKSQVAADTTIRAVASKKSITAIFISSPKMLMSYGFLAQIFALFEKHQTPIDLISTSEVSVALTIDDTEHLPELRSDLAAYGDVRVLHDVAIISVIGRQFRERSGIAGKVFSALKDTNILMISGGASDINLSFVVANEDANDVVKQLHSQFFV